MLIHDARCEMHDARCMMQDAEGRARQGGGANDDDLPTLCYSHFAHVQ